MRSPTKETELGNLPNVSVLELYVSNPTQIHDVAQAVTKTGGVDVVLNNAGYALTGPLEVSTDEQVITQISTNQIGAIFVPLNAVYHATKWALEGFNESLAFELKPFNVTVKSISPGSMKSDFMGKAQMVDDEHYAESFQKMLAMFGHALPGSEPEQIAQVIYEAATDGKDQLRYVAGADAIATYKRRLEIGSESFHSEWMKQFAG
jgi:NAD(P)-dependent dehydrogenase (short-subunit alcohol dehydrogenase family)